MQHSRRELLAMLPPALGGAALHAHLGASTDARSATISVEDGDGDAWPRRRQAIERAWLDLLGDFPTDVPDLRPEMKQVAVEDGVTLPRELSDRGRRSGDRLAARTRLRPPHTDARHRLHSQGSGKDSTIGLSGRRPVDPPRDPAVGADYGRQLARHGFVTLSIDLLTDGERIGPNHRVMDTRPFYLEHPEWSIVGKNVWDVMRSVDFLQTLDFVDGEAIGAAGWSLGGHSALFAAAFEPRITATISNGGVLDWHRTGDHWSRKPTTWKPWVKGDPPTNSEKLERRFGFKTNSGPYVYVKKFRPYIEDQTKTIPVDFDELMMLVAPRPLMIVSTEQEFYGHAVLPKCLEAFKVYLNWRDVEGLPSVVAARRNRIGYAETLDYYETQHGVAPERIPGRLSTLGAGDCFGWFSFPGGHAYPGVARRHTFAWFDRWLGRTLS